MKTNKKQNKLYLLLCAGCLMLMSACGMAPEDESSAVAGSRQEVIYGHILDVNQQARTVTVDQVEIVRKEDTDRVTALALSDRDFNSDGTYVYNSRTGRRLFALSDEVDFDYTGSLATSSALKESVKKSTGNDPNAVYGNGANTINNSISGSINGSKSQANGTTSTGSYNFNGSTRSGIANKNSAVAQPDVSGLTYSNGADTNAAQNKNTANSASQNTADTTRGTTGSMVKGTTTNSMNNGTTGMNNGTTGMNNGTTGMTNGTTGMTNGTTGMNNGTSSMTNGTTGMTNGTTGINNGTTGMTNGTTGMTNGTNQGGIYGLDSSLGGTVATMEENFQRLTAGIRERNGALYRLVLENDRIVSISDVSSYYR